MDSGYDASFNEHYDLLMQAWPWASQLRSAGASLVKKALHENSLFEESSSQGNSSQGNSSHGNSSLDGTLRIVELGCGKGQYTAHLAQAVMHARISAVDSDPRVFSPRPQAARLEWVCNDALSYMKEQEPGSVDVVTSCWLLHNLHKDDRARLVRQIAGALKPGGWFVNLDKYVADKTEGHRMADQEYFVQSVLRLSGLSPRFDEAGATQVLLQAISHEYRDLRPEYAMAESESMQQLRKLGFEHVNAPFRIYRDAILMGQKPRQ